MKMEWCGASDSTRKPCSGSVSGYSPVSLDRFATNLARPRKPREKEKGNGDKGRRPDDKSARSSELAERDEPFRAHLSMVVNSY